MAIAFADASADGVHGVTGSVPDSSIIGLIGDSGQGSLDLLRLAAGEVAPRGGTVTAAFPRRYVKLGDTLSLGGAASVALDRPFALADPVEREQGLIELERARRSGAAILFFSHDETLLLRVCDEVWWIHEGRLACRGAAADALAAYQAHTARRLKDWAAAQSPPVEPTLRQGDGRAELISIETLDEVLRPVQIWRGGEPAAVRVRVRFAASVADPVVGMLLRTRTGQDAYGTNTELEGLRLGPVAAGDTIEILFRFQCALCPREYILTAASHDPDGVWHDWVEDAVLIPVADRRYTAGVANLRASVEARKL
jgi:hypothetical protein